MEGGKDVNGSLTSYSIKVAVSCITSVGVFVIKMRGQNDSLIHRDFCHRSLVFIKVVADAPLLKIVGTSVLSKPVKSVCQLTTSTVSAKTNQLTTLQTNFGGPTFRRVFHENERHYVMLNL